VDRADRGRLAGIAVPYGVGVGLLLWANRRFGIGGLPLLSLPVRKPAKLRGHTSMAESTR